MSKWTKIALAVYLTFVIVGAVLIASLIPRPDGKPHSAPILADLSLFPESAAQNAGQNFLPHEYYTEATTCGGTGGFFGVGNCDSTPALAAGQSVELPAGLQLPVNPDEPIACEEIFTANINVNSNSPNDVVYMVPGGVGNPQNGGCPMFPYVGGHAYGAGYALAPDGVNPADLITTGSLGFGTVTDQRSDRITFNGATGCDPTVETINSLSVSGTTVTASVASNTHILAGHYVQVVGNISVPADNSQFTVGNNNDGSFLVTAANTTSISYTDTNVGVANCSANCGTLSWPNYPGVPPYNLLNGLNGSAPVVQLEIEMPAAAIFHASYTLWARAVCIPIPYCSMTQGSGCGQGASVYW